MDSQEQILEILQRADSMPKKQPFRPNLQPIIGGKGGAPKFKVGASGGVSAT